MKEFPDGHYDPNPPASALRLKDTTLEEHREYGRLTRLFRIAMMHLYTRCNHGKNTAKAARAIERTLHHLDEVRNQMDNIVCHDHNAYHNAHRLYYGHEGLNEPTTLDHREVEP